VSEVIDLAAARLAKLPRVRDPLPAHVLMPALQKVGVWPRLWRAERQVLPRTERFQPANGDTVQLEDGPALTLIEPAESLYSLNVELPDTTAEQKRVIVVTKAVGALQVRSAAPVIGWDGLFDTHGYAVIAFQYTTDIG
jgi:hypothetical protein